MKYFALNTSSNNDTKVERLLHLASAVVGTALQQYGMTDRVQNIQPYATCTNASASTTSSEGNNAGM